MIETIIIVVAVLLVVVVAAVLALAASKPDIFRVKRATSIKAPPDKIFTLINDFHNWGSWSPYENKDPAMKRTFGGAPNGIGAVYGWEGNRNIGSGRMEITDASPPSRIKLKLDFVKPFVAHNIVEFTLEPSGDAANVTTNVTWAMHGPTPFFGRIIHVFIDMDRMVGADFETGLANLKIMTEMGRAAKSDARPISP
jgi:uncharacterized protein YndB with AHSA1/START domain